MSTDAFFQAMMLFIFCSFIVERSLVVLFETEYFISKFGRRKHIRPTIVILYTMLFVFIVDLNLALVIKGWGKTDPVVKINEQGDLSPDAFRFGHVSTLEGENLVVWMELESAEPLHVSVHPNR